MGVVETRLSVGACGCFGWVLANGPLQRAKPVAEEAEVAKSLRD